MLSYYFFQPRNSYPILWDRELPEPAKLKAEHTHPCVCFRQGKYRLGRTAKAQPSTQRTQPGTPDTRYCVHQYSFISDHTMKSKGIGPGTHRSQTRMLDPLGLASPVGVATVLGVGKGAGVLYKGKSPNCRAISPAPK